MMPALEAVKDVPDTRPDDLEAVVPQVLSWLAARKQRIPKLPLHRRNFFAMLARRFRWLRDASSRLFEIQVGLVAEGFLPQPVTSRKVKKY